MRKSQFKIFIVEDDKWYGEILEYHLLLNPDYEVERFESGKDLLDNLHKNPAVITLDYMLPDFSGSQLLKKVKAFDPEIPVIIISGQEDVSTAIDLLKEGVYDYIVKDENTKDRLWNSIIHIKENLKLKDEISMLREEIGQKYDFNNVIKGESSAIKKTFLLMEKAITTNITVSITGETGTGKELVAKAIHYNSARKKNPFVAVNVAAIPKELIESELFGHEKGAFTGAIARRVGKFEEANNGTILLDEICEMDLTLQSKLLRVLQEKEICRIGSNSIIKTNARVIVATNKNIQEEVRNGNFREDLYYRLLGLPIQLPPLRERGNDIIIIAKYFMKEFCKENKLGKMRFSHKVAEKLLKYPFPGNIRELKAVVDLAVVLSDGNTIEADDINFNTTNSLNDLMANEMTLKDYTNKIIKHYLEKHDNKVLLVAKKLDIGKSTIYRIFKNG